MLERVDKNSTKHLILRLSGYFKIKNVNFLPILEIAKPLAH